MKDSKIFNSQSWYKSNGREKIGKEGRYRMKTKKSDTQGIESAKIPGLGFTGLYL